LSSSPTRTAEVIDLTDEIDNMPTPPRVLNNIEDINSDDVPLDTPTAEHIAALQSAITTAPISRLREICARLVVSDNYIADALSEELLGLSGHTGEIMPKWAICVHCGEEYSPQAQGDEGECRFHPGMSVFRQMSCFNLMSLQVFLRSTSRSLVTGMKILLDQ
jgi:hypothetical protein